MPHLPITINCYAARIAQLQQQLNGLLERARTSATGSEELERLEQQIQPLYAAIWAMHAELESR
jgi:hypothetical protein